SLACIGQTSLVLADGKSVQELVPGVESFEFQFAMTEEAAKGGYGFKGPMRVALKARGGTDFRYGVVFNIKDDVGCGEKHNPMYSERGTVETMGWIDMVKAGETVNATIAGEDIYDGLNNFLRKCGSTPAGMSLEIRLLTLAQSKMGKNESGDIDHELSKIVIPIANSAVGSMMSAADEKVYEEFRTGDKAHSVKDDALVQSIEEELNRLKKGKADIMTIHIQSISYQNAQNTVLKWYAHNIYKNEDGQCKYGYIYGEASKYNGGYSFNYFNGEREEFIGCEYAEKLRNR
ncbi:MAG: hypothetical protein AAFY41_12925, partial [Bacteroidota bacterium]